MNINELISSVRSASEQSSNKQSDTSFQALFFGSDRPDSGIGSSEPPRFGIAVFHAAGDILNSTPVARQLKHDHPQCHITWFTAKRFAFVLENNPYIDEVVVMDGDPLELDKTIPSLKDRQSWTKFYTPAPYMNSEKLVGATLYEWSKAATGLKWTVPYQSVVRLTDEEVAQAHSYMASLPKGLKILVETEFTSHQSPWNARYEEMLIERLTHLQPVFIFTAKNRPTNLDAIREKYGNVFWCDLPFRHNAELYNLCDAFVGVSSGISCLSFSDWCRNDVPSIEVVLGEHWSTFPFQHHEIRRVCLDEKKFAVALDWLSAILVDDPGALRNADRTPTDLIVSYRHDKIAYVSKEALPVDYGREGRMRTLTNFLDEQQPYVYVHGGIGDALLALSEPLDSGVPLHVIACMNSQQAAETLLGMFPQIEHITLLPAPDDYATSVYLRGTVINHKNCMSSGITPPGREDLLWNESFNLADTRGVRMYPRWVQAMEGRKIADVQVVLAPKGSVFGTFRSKRNTLNPRYWNALLDCLEAWDITPVVIGTPDEEEYYPLRESCIDRRSFDLADQMSVLRAADCVIAADSWHKTFAAMASVPCVVFEPLHGHDLDALVDSSSYVFIKPWKEIRFVTTFAEAADAISILLAKPASTVHDIVRTVRESPRTNAPVPISVKDPVFNSFDYDNASRVLIRDGDCFRQDIYLPSVVRTMRERYPHLMITVAGNADTRDMFKGNDDIAGTVDSHSPECFSFEGRADIIINYRHIVDVLQERWSYHLQDLMHAIAGLPAGRRPLDLSLSVQERREAQNLLYTAFGNKRRLRIGLSGLHHGEVRHCYAHMGMLSKMIHDAKEDTQLVHFGRVETPNLSSSVLDCAREQIALRTQFAMMEECDVIITIDSEFYSVATLMYNKPTILLLGPSSERLIGNEKATNVVVVRNKDEGCTQCFGNCSKYCLGTLHPYKVLEELAFMINPSQRHNGTPRAAHVHA